jgi:flagellar assembly protein FliH
VTRPVEVVFHAFLRGAILADPAALLPPLPAPPKPPQTLWETEIGQQLAQDRQRIELALSRLADVLRALDERHRERLSEWQRAAIELGVAIAARLLHDRIEAGDMAIESVVREVVARLKPDEPVTVRLHPTDLTLLQKRLGDVPLFHDRAGVRVIADPSLGRGDCRAEGKDTSVLSELSVQLATMRQQLLGSLGHARTEP